eukprot:CCRYP_000580-RA/>CCRYP_000580-RA protein AED:0.13 eAED:0.13 QI:30/1/1/1/0/0/2/50/45
MVSLCIFGTGNGRPCYGLAPSFSSRETGLCSNHLVFHQKFLIFCE